MPTVTMLLAAAADAAKHARYADPAEVRTIRDVAAANREDVYPFVHTFDPELAAAWLAKAMTFTVAGYDALSNEGKYEYTRQLWVAVGNVFKALNVRMYGWEPFRLIMERLLGAPPRDSDEYLRGKPADELPGRYGGAWREDAIRFWAQAQGHSPYRGGPETVVFGRKQDFAIGSMGCNILVADGAPYGNSLPGIADTCQNPTGEAHRLWWQSNGSERGGNGDMYRQASGGFTGYVAEQQDAGVGSGFDALGRSVSGARLPNRLFWIPGLRAYFDLGLEVAQTLDAAVRATSLVEFVRNVRRDVILRNRALENRYSVPVDRLPAEAVRRYEREVQDQMVTTGLVDAAGRAVAGIAGTINPVAGIIAGAVSLVTSAAVRAAIGSPGRYIDVLGRPTPAYEVFAQSDSVGGIMGVLRNVPWPEGIPRPSDYDARMLAEKERLAHEASKQAQRDRDRQGSAPAQPPPRPPPPPRGGSGDGGGDGGGDGVGTLLALGALGGAGYLAWKQRAALKRALGGR